MLKHQKVSKYDESGCSNIFVLLAQRDCLNTVARREYLSIGFEHYIFQSEISLTLNGTLEMNVKFSVCEVDYCLCILLTKHQF